MGLNNPEMVLSSILQSDTHRKKRNMGRKLVVPSRVYDPIVRVAAIDEVPSSAMKPAFRQQFLQRLTILASAVLIDIGNEIV
jgi:hypothetical protein